MTSHPMAQMATIGAGNSSGRADVPADNTGVAAAAPSPSRGSASAGGPAGARAALRSAAATCDGADAGTSTAVRAEQSTGASALQPPAGTGSAAAPGRTEPCQSSSVGPNATPAAARAARAPRRPAPGDASDTPTASTKEEVHVKAVKTVSVSWFNLSRKAGTDKATLMDHYRRLFKLTLMLIEKYDAELDSEMRNRVLERMRFCHMALAPRVPSLLQIFSTIEAVFATADVDVSITYSSIYIFIRSLRIGV